MVEVDTFSNRGFYIGDICYVLDDDIYYGVWGRMERREDGSWYDKDRDSPGFQSGEFSHNGFTVGVSGTAYGDGCYPDSTGTVRFPVDAGVIGIVPLELVNDMGEAERLGVVVPGTRAHMSEYGGVFEFCVYEGSRRRLVEIDTAGDDDEEDDW